MFDGRLGRQQHAQDVDVKHLMVLVLGHGLDRRELVDTGVVDQHVEATESLHSGLDHALGLVGLGHVPLHRDGLAAGLGDGLDQGVRPGLARYVVHHYRGAFRRKRLGDARADALGGPGDHRDFACEF